MSSWYQPLLRFLNNEDGPTAVEYSVMLALIVVVCIAAIGSIGTNANAIFNNVALNAAIGNQGVGFLTHFLGAPNESTNWQR